MMHGDDPDVAADESADDQLSLIFAALDQDAEARRLRDAGDEGDGRGEDQGAGGGRHQHGEAADGISREEPCGGGEQER
ncbi:MAG TPA: hypothetical protein VJJ77_01460, partial [Dongiaceae bacterium]|nr:hypothetical protein [Dongiaceae bacterium]